MWMLAMKPLVLRMICDVSLCDCQLLFSASQDKRYLEAFNLYFVGAS